MSKTRSTPPSADPTQDKLADTLRHAINRALTEGRLSIINGANLMDCAALIVEPARTPRAPAWMADAQSTDAALRQQVREGYQRCLEIFRTAVRPQDTTFDNAGAALAFFVAVNMNALHDLDTTSETLLLLERQLLGVVRESAAWDSASIAERQFYFEQMAMLGVFFAGVVAHARTQGAAAVTRAQDVARGYLHRVLGMDPDLLTFGANGLALRSAAAQPH